MSRAILQAHGLRQIFRSRDRPGRGPGIVAVDGVSLSVQRGECVAVVGESGSGKSTLARLLLALESAVEGEVLFDDIRISHAAPHTVRPLRRRFQAVFQDPTSSMNPVLSVATIVAEPLVAHRLGTSESRRERVVEALAQVGLSADAARLRPASFSAGERQRIAIARALAPRPELLILDEPVSSLDVSVQATILELIHRLRREMSLSVVLISHDLGVVRDISDRVHVMFRGKFVEQGATGAVLGRPAHPYTRALLAAAPQPTPDWRPPVIQRHGVVGDGGCRYADRCPLREAQCEQEPDLIGVTDDHHAACWKHEEVLSFEF